MPIHFGTDHAGFELKEKLLPFVREELGYEVKDHGAFELDEHDDYPDFVVPVAQAVANDPEGSRGLVLGGSGQGEAICANRFPGARAVVFYHRSREDIRDGRQMIALTREHNDANILSLGARFLADGEAQEAVRLWLETPFSGEERHQRRLDKLSKIKF